MTRGDMDDEHDISEIEALEREIPFLARARAFADALSEVKLFARVGEPLSEDERALAELYLDGLGFPQAEPALLPSWEDAADAALALDVDPEGWAQEEQIRAALTETARLELSEEALLAGLALVAEKAGEHAREAVDEAGAMFDIVDEGLLNAAAGSAVQAANGAALSLMAGHDGAEEPFIVRFRLFARGRWPIGLAGLTYNLL